MLIFILSDDTSKKQKDPKDVFLQKISTVDNYLQQFLHGCIVKFSYKDTALFRKVNLFSII